MDETTGLGVDGQALVGSSDILTQLLQQRVSIDPELAKAMGAKSDAFVQGVKANSDTITNAALDANTQYQQVSGNTAHALVTNAERIAAGYNTQIANQAAALAAQQTITESTNNARQTAILQVGGMQALDAMGLKLQQAMAINEQKQLAAQQAVKSSNPMVEGLLSAFGIKSQAQSAVEDADNAESAYTRTVAQRKELVSAMQSSDSLITQLGTALNATTTKAALDAQAASASTESAKLANLAASNDSQSMLQLATLSLNQVNHNFSTVKTITDANSSVLKAQFDADKQNLSVMNSTKTAAKDRVTGTANAIGAFSHELKLAYMDAAGKGDTAGMEEAVAKTTKLGEAATLLGVSPKASKDWAKELPTVEAVATMKAAGMPDTKILESFHNPLLTAKIVNSPVNSGLTSGEDAQFNPEAIGAINALLDSLAKQTASGKLQKPLVPTEIGSVNRAFDKVITNEARNIFDPRNKILRMDMSSVAAAAETSPQFAANPVVKFLMNRYKEQPKAHITLDDFRWYLLTPDVTEGFTNVNRSRESVIREMPNVLRVMNTLYVHQVNKSGVRMYGASSSVVPDVLTLKVDDENSVPITSPDALTKAFKHTATMLQMSPRASIGADIPLTDLLIPQEGDK
jgi:hypothetical protein